jgi:hypothetical protein
LSERLASVKKWPRELSPNRVRPIIERPALTGPKPLRGRAQTVLSSAGGWRFIYGEVAFTGRRYLQFRALVAYLKGRQAPIYVGPFDYPYAPHLVAGVSRPTLTKFSDNTGFSDGTDFSESSSHILLSDSIGPNVTTLLAYYASTPFVLRAGNYFELAGRLHILDQVKDLGGGDWEWRFWPPTRAAYEETQKIEVDDPRCLCYLDPDSDAPDPDLQFGHLGHGTFDFIEADW